jgi:PAS domain S-box-containing protein
MKPTPDEPILSAEETARMLHIHANTLRRWTAEGKIRRCPPFHRGEWRYSLRDIENVCRRQGLNAPAPCQNPPADTSPERARPGRLLAEDALPVIWIVSIERPQRLTYISPSITRLLGYTTQEMMAVEMKDAFTPPSLGRLGRAMADNMGELEKEMGSPDGSVVLDLEMIHKDGSAVPVEVEATYIPGSDGRPREILAIAHEITDQPRARQVEQRPMAEDSRILKQPTG